MFREEFAFGRDFPAEQYYMEETGAGFVDLAKPVGESAAESALFAGGWNLRESAKEEYPYAFRSSESGVYVEKPRHALVFKASVPEYGSYRVTVTVTADKDIHGMSIWTGRRNLAERDIELNAGETKTGVYHTFVSPYIPAIKSEPSTEKAIYVSVTGVNAGISAICIERVTVPALFVAGDSTLTDQNAPTPYYRKDSYCGWAQVITQYLPGMAVCNQAHSGLTTNCFRDDGHLDTILDLIRPGDVFLMQFGHNDQKRRNLAAFGGYINNLRRYVKAAREKGAIPVIVSPISRIPFCDDLADLADGSENNRPKTAEGADKADKGKMCSLLQLHAEACRTAAEELSCVFIDLHDITFRRWCEYGIDQTKGYFAKGDITHTNDYGANLIAGFVAAEIQRQDILPLNKYVNKKTIMELTPDEDMDPIPVEPVPVTGLFDLEPPFVDIKGIPEYEGLKNAYKKALLDPCVMHLHPYDMMPRAQFFMVYFKALRIEGKRPYKGRFWDLSRYEWDSSYIEAALEKNLIDPATTPDNRFRPDDPLAAEELASLLIRGFLIDKDNAEWNLADCFAAAKERKLIPDNIAEHDIANRATCYIALAKLSDLMNTGDRELPKDAEIHPVK